MKNNDFSKKLGLRIKELRIAKKFKQTELADMLDMERSNLTRIENGMQRPNDENIIRIAKFLEVEVKDLFDFEHFIPRKTLISQINKYLNEMNDSQVQYIHKSVRNLLNVKT